ncbi:MAG: competence/damage-inducible protein CinA-like protein [Thermoleophilia bacterium]|nr:competence/damage-inducible protein CinA-like protein [Thermoleophilia bacterium]
MTSPAPAPRARLLLTGDELLRGFVQDANSGFVAAQLRELGIELDQVRVVGDDFGVISDALVEALERDEVDLVVVTGGLGPTHDDRTSEAVARALGTSLELDEAALAVVEARVRAYGRMRTPEEVATFTPGNRKQATLPAGATWADPLGTAPGYAVEAGGRVVVVLPGPPSELRHAWSGVARTPEVAAVRARVPARHERLIRFWGVPESRASQALVEVGHEDAAAARVTLCARDGELEVSVRGDDAGAVDALVAQLDGALPGSAFATDDHRSVVELVAQGLLDRDWWLATAESCTGGMLGSLVTGVPGAGNWYLGGVVSYANEAKSELLGVAPELVAEHGAVSEPVARAMAEGVRDRLSAQVGIGITGLAGPSGGTEEKPVGTVHLGIALPGATHHRQIRVPGDRETVRRRSCVIVLHELRRLLERS